MGTLVQHQSRSIFGTQPQKLTLCVIYQIKDYYLWTQKSDGAKAVAWRDFCNLALK